MFFLKPELVGKETELAIRNRCGSRGEKTLLNFHSYFTPDYRDDERLPERLFYILD